MTSELDEMEIEELDRETLFKVVLWKVSRYPYVSDLLLQKISSVRNLNQGEHEQAHDLLAEMLRTHGIALPMASTILRFVNPTVFQIIDDRAYRVLLPGEAKYPTKPSPITEGYVNRSIEIYFAYISKIMEVSGKGFPFEQADRILYQLDLKLKNQIGDST